MSSGPGQATRVLHLICRTLLLCAILAPTLAAQADVANTDYTIAKSLLKLPPSLLVSESAKFNELIYEFEPVNKDDVLQIVITAGDVHENFKIDGRYLRINKALDYEKVRSYALSIKVAKTHEADDEDQSERRRLSVPAELETFTLSVLVRNENDNVPLFSSEVYNATVLEEVDEPVLVTQLFASDVDLSEQENEGLLRYSIIEPLDVPFRIDARYGTIWTTSKIDREQHANFDLRVAVEDEGGLSSTCRVLVTVADKNDNPPRFTRLFSVNITENAAPGTFVVQVTSSDNDLASYAEATYSFIGSSEAFEIAPHSGKIFLASKLDREVREEYLLMVAANDSSWRTQTTLTINVLDENDNSPVFEKSVYEYKRAASSRERRVGHVRAFDADKGLNAQVEYSLKNASELFAINAQTGELWLRVASLDKAPRRNDSSHEPSALEQQYNVTVIATDKGQIARSSEVPVVITLLPDEQLVYNQSKAVHIPIPYDLRNGTVIYSLRSTMAEPLPISNLEEVGAAHLLIQVEGRQVIYTGETQVQPGEEYSYKLESSYGDAEPMHIVLVVVAPNAHAPQFQQNRRQIVVAENRDPGESLVQLLASDADVETFNNDIVYEYKVVEWKWNERALDYYNSLQAAQGKGRKGVLPGHKELGSPLDMQGFLDSTDEKILDPFRLERERGILFLAAHLDYELVVMYRLEVTARDSAWFGSLNSTATLTIHVTDTNDNQPIFINLKELQRGMEVFENNPIGHIVGEVAAIDFDSPLNSQITFQIEPQYDYQDFAISAKTGQIQALVSFDYEKQSEYSLKVSAKNDNEMKQSILVKVRVQDINELDGRFAADPLTVGLTIVSLFFVILLLVILTSFVVFRSQKKKDGCHGLSTSALNNNSHPRKLSTLPPSVHVPIKTTHYHVGNASGISPSSTLHSGHLSSGAHLVHQSHSHSSHPTLMSHGGLGAMQGHSPAGKVRPPDVVDQPVVSGMPLPPSAPMVRAPPAPPSSFSLMSPVVSDKYGEILVAAENYDLENASSIAPSDIDLVYHYKGFGAMHRHGHEQGPGSSQPGHRHAGNAVPLARLSPSVSELTSPRILTLHDLSPQSMQPSCPQMPRTQPNMAPPPPPAGKHGATRQGMPPDSSDDDDGNTVNSFTSSEYDEPTYEMSGPKDNSQIAFQRVW